MFSGIVEMTGTVTAITEANQVWRYRIEAPGLLNDVKQGDSIAVNGVCLTVVAFNESWFEIEIVPETQRKTNLGYLVVDSQVNLERSITASQRIGGHFVQGHVDAVGEIESLQTEGDAWLLKISLPKSLAIYVVPKGFIAVDGMSLTVIEAAKDYFTLTLIPHTREITTAAEYQIGSVVNLEVDMLGKYVVNYLEGRDE